MSSKGTAHMLDSPLHPLLVHFPIELLIIGFIALMIVEYIKPVMLFNTLTLVFAIIGIVLLFMTGHYGGKWFMKCHTTVVHPSLTAS